MGTPRVTIAEIRAEDVRWKPGGAQFDQDAAKLAALADARGRRITFEYLKSVGMGDPKNPNPITVGVIPRLVETLSVLYAVPATRRLKQGRKVLADSNPAVETWNEHARRMCIDNVWQLADAKRNLQRQALISWVESPARQSVQARIIEPHQFMRIPNPSAADVIEEDSAVAICILDAPRPEDQRWQLWQREDDGTWCCWVVDGSDTMVGDQPYGDGGAVPFRELPLQLVYDDLPAGRPWLPVPESRLDFALNINALMADLAFLVKQQAHTTPWAKSDDPGALPTQTGPDKMIKLPGDAEIGILDNNPKIADSIETIEFTLSALCLSESLATDTFARSRTVRTGPALRVAERDLERRRQRQQPLAVDDERRAFRKIRAILNHYASEWDLEPIAEDLTMAASFSRQWQPVDVRDLQQTSGFDLAIGTASVIDYIQERYACTREEAIDLYEQVQADRESYPVKQQQNPAALLDGPMNPALGRDGAAKVPGAFNPDLATSTEGASVVDAIRMSDAPAETSSTPAPMPGEAVTTAPVASAAGEKAQDTALNGAQVEAAKGIVKDVADGLLPRETGIAMLVEFFNLDPARAERVMGPVGRSFEPKAPEPAKPAPATQVAPAASQVARNPG